MSNEVNGKLYYDRKGDAEILFGGIPIRAVKRVSFKDKLGTIYSLTRMVLNSVLYDFTKSSQGGCVMFSRDYSEWEFVAPDGRLRVEDGVYSGKTFIEGLRQLQTITSDNPIPAWDEFARWLDTRRTSINDKTSYLTVYLMTPDQSSLSECTNDFTLTETASFPDFLEDVITLVSSASDLQNMDSYLVGNTIQWVLKCTSSMLSKPIIMHFTFRE